MHQGHVDELIAMARHGLDKRDAEIKRLRLALIKHGEHTSGCRYRGGFDCDCGWSDLWREEMARTDQ